MKACRGNNSSVDLRLQDDDDPFINTNFSAATTVRLWAKDAAAIVNVPYNYTKQEMAAIPSFVSTALRGEGSLSHEDITDLKFTASSMYGKKAQAELDFVIGERRVPGFADQARLPCINALVTEVLRWNSVAPTGKEAQRDPRNACFGYGRRICPGYFAKASLFACIATSLAVFNIDKVGATGVPIVKKNFSDDVQKIKKDRKLQKVAYIAETGVDATEGGGIPVMVRMADDDGVYDVDDVGIGITAGVFDPPAVAPAIKICG
ncbi:hypothetical protein BYT27DRAFT_7250289 [Phlegmacium glaucopus]|nr:hypothetical protein BYT27DRAFT_7250289 [Phlegmacium glaucopus]